MTVLRVALIASMLLPVEFASSAQRAQPIALEGADCGRINMRFGDFEVARASQHAAIPVSAGTLDVRPPANGGVRIERGAGREYSVTACVAAGAATRDDAQRLADAARLNISGNSVRVENAAGGRSWSVQIIVEVPDGGSVNAETTNGPISISGASGKFNVRAANGPIDLADVSGSVEASATNGPISVSGNRGDITAETRNGPVSVRLKGSRWEGRLDARAHSGPLDVTLPSDYRSGVEISSRGGSPWSCRAAACRDGARDWDQSERTLRVGPEPVVVRVSTVNGPVTVR